MKLPKQTLPRARGAVHAALPHDSAERHVRGDALYVDDLPEPRDLLHAYVRLSERAHARILRLDLEAVKALPGVEAVMAAPDLPAANDIGPVLPGDPVFADGHVEYFGQSVFAVAADTAENARRAAHRAVIDYQDLPAILSVEEALAGGSFVLPTEFLRRGNTRAELARSARRLTGTLSMGGQDHFYLEGQVAMAVPREGGDLRVYSSTQHPSEVQHLVAKVLGLRDHQVVVEVRRVGGAFGGKETQAALIACIAALLSQRTGRPVKLRLERDEDMLLTGKRHDFKVDYDVGFDESGRIRALDLVLASRCGISPDLSGAVNDRAMLHADNCYWLPHVSITSHRCRTHTVSNTAFRGFGGPQGMMAIEWVVDEVARSLGEDPLEVRKRNFYGSRTRNTTPYGMKVEGDVLPRLVRELERSAGYAARRKEVSQFNGAHPWRKRGLALTPVKFGISFTATQMNQAGALVHVYADGSVLLNHGGIEMGQGIYVKVAQVVADEFGIDLDRVKVTATTTEKVPNTSPTAASAGSDLNGKAAEAAARAIKKRMARVASARLGGRPATRCSSAGRSASAVAPSPSPSSRPWPTAAGSPSRRPATTARPWCTGTGAGSADGPSTTSPGARRSRRSRSTPSPGSTRCEGWISSTTAAAPSIPPLTGARSREGSCRAWDGSPARSCAGTGAASSPPTRPPPTRSPPAATSRRTSG